jgi:hypothetical protein
VTSPKAPQRRAVSRPAPVAVVPPRAATSYRPTDPVPMPNAEDWLAGYAVAFRWPHSCRKALELAAEAHQTSVSGYVEGVLLAGLIERGLVGD